MGVGALPTPASMIGMLREVDNDYSNRDFGASPKHTSRCDSPIAIL